MYNRIYTNYTNYTLLISKKKTFLLWKARPCNQLQTNGSRKSIAYDCHFSKRVCVDTQLLKISAGVEGSTIFAIIGGLYDSNSIVFLSFEFVVQLVIILTSRSKDRINVGIARNLLIFSNLQKSLDVVS